MKNKCLATIEKNADFIVDLILKEVTPKEVCLALGFCFARQDFVELIPLPEVKPTPNEYTCRICQMIVQKVEEQLNNKTTQEDVEKCVQQICTVLPNKLQSECKKFIVAYANEIVKHFPSGSPKELCEKVNVCESEEGEIPSRSEEIGM